ncbi:MAG: hypothetical protein V7607_2534 [Solirubrobacteraceae bacterium]
MKVVVRVSRVRLAMLLIALGAIFLASAAIASAGGTAENIRWLWLYFPSQQGDAACKQRTIYLAADSYYWENGFDVEREETHWPQQSRYILLAAGNYTWQDCVLSYSGASPGLWHESSLHTANHKTAYLPTYWVFPRDYDLWGPDYYWSSFGSTLTPL